MKAKTYSKSQDDCAHRNVTLDVVGAVSTHAWQIRWKCPECGRSERQRITEPNWTNNPNRKERSITPFAVPAGK